MERCLCSLPEADRVSHKLDHSSPTINPHSGSSCSSPGAINVLCTDHTAAREILHLNN